jgi:hypothetical protein
MKIIKICSDEYFPDVSNNTTVLVSQEVMHNRSLKVTVEGPAATPTPCVCIVTCRMVHVTKMIGSSSDDWIY